MTYLEPSIYFEAIRFLQSEYDIDDVVEYVLIVVHVKVYAHLAHFICIVCKQLEEVAFLAVLFLGH